MEELVMVNLFIIMPLLIHLASAVLNNSDSLAAKLCLAEGETPCFPMMDSRMASASSLFSITAFPCSGTEPSLEKAICRNKMCQSRRLIVSLSNGAGDAYREGAGGRLSEEDG